MVRFLWCQDPMTLPVFSPHDSNSAISLIDNLRHRDSELVSTDFSRNPDILQCRISSYWYNVSCSCSLVARQRHGMFSRDIHLAGISVRSAWAKFSHKYPTKVFQTFLFWEQVHWSMRKQPSKVDSVWADGRQLSEWCNTWPCFRWVGTKKPPTNSSP